MNITKYLNRLVKIAIITVSLLSLTACMNTKFSCDTTAGDVCMDVEQADNLSQQGLTLEDIEPNDNNESSEKGVPAKPLTGNKEIWIAPYTDDNGQYHTEQFVYVNLDPVTENTDA